MAKAKSKKKAKATQVVKLKAKKSSVKTKSSTKRKTAVPVKSQARPKGDKIGIFGGTFNPVHYGHMNSLESVYKDLKLKQIWVLPTFKNPLRAAEEGPNPEFRLKMVQMAVDALNHGNPGAFVVRNDEMQKATTCYTVDSLKAFRKENPSNQYFLIVGADQLEVFNQWKDFEKILEMANLVVTSRPGIELPTIKSELPAWLAALTVNFRKNKLKLKTGNEVVFVQLTDVLVSATEVRKKIRLGEKADHLTPNSIIEFIKTNNIYNEVAQKISSYEDLTRFCAEILNEKGALDTRGYDVRELVQPSEYTIAASGTSTRHTKALAEHVIKAVKEKYHVYPQSSEGLQEGRWVVVDYGSLLIHVFYDFVRGEYRIEDLWSKGVEILN